MAPGRSGRWNRSEQSAAAEDILAGTQAVSLGSTDTLIQRPAALTHHLVEPSTRAAAGIFARPVAAVGGLAHHQDPWSDLERALGTARRGAPPPTSPDR